MDISTPLRWSYIRYRACKNGQTPAYWRYTKHINGTHQRSYLICTPASIKEVIEYTTVSTDHLRYGAIIHMDFYVLPNNSVCGFILALLIIDAQNRKLWEFATPNKRPPLDIVTFFLSQLSKTGRPVMIIHTNREDELAKSTEFCKMIKRSHQVSLDTSYKYSSWLKVNSKFQTKQHATCYGLVKFNMV